MSRIGNGFGRGRPRDRNKDSVGFNKCSKSDSCTTLFVPPQDCGKIIGKGGSKIRELQDTTRAQIKISRDNERDGTRKVEISGEEAAIEKARHMIENLVGLGTKGDSWRNNGGAPRNNISAHNNTSVVQANFDEEEWGTESHSKIYTSYQAPQADVHSGWDDDDGWNDTPTQGTWTNSERSSGSRGTDVRCHKCGQDGHFARDCSQSFSGGSRGGGRVCHKCGEEGHFARDCPQSGGGGGSRRGACFKCGHEGHMARDCPDQQSRDGFGSSQRSNNNNWRQDPQEDGVLSDVIFVSGNDVGRIIGKGGSKIREIQEDSGCKLKVSRDEAEFGEVEVTLTGDHDAICKAKKLIYKCGVSFCGGEIEEEEEEVEETKPVKIDWKYIRENQERFERERFADCGPIEKEFYIEEDHICNMHPEDVRQFRKQNNNIMVDNVDCPEIPVPNPVRTFEDAFGHFPMIMGQIKKQGFKTPSPIQCQAWPILMSGLDLIGIAQTGTGKTLAFLLPAMLHIDGQEIPRTERSGPTCLVLCPTRELALQIQEEVNKISYKGIKSVCVYGGGNRREQISTVKKGVEIVVATPGRLNDLIMNEIICVKSVSYLVLDEADRMLDMGFEPDIRKVLLDIRPDRQTVMTSATWPEDVQRLAKQYMTKPMHVHVGTLDLAAVHSVKQEVLFMDDEEKKDYLFDFLNMMEPTDKVIVFVGKKIKADDISSDLALNGISCQCIHGDREQSDRVQALEEFKHSVVRILVATDVASRGLDVKDITHVLNYDFPRNIEDYVHRVGRTGRAGMTGTAVTFLTRGDWRSAQQLIDIMAEANQEVPEELIQMAERFQARKERDERGGRRGGRGGRGGFGGRGRGGGGRFGRGGGRFDHDDFVF